MMNTTHNPIRFKNSLISILIGLLALSTLSVQAQEQLDSRFFYYVNGNTVGYWGLTLGDEDNWALGIPSKEGDSARKQLTISKAMYKNDGDAINLKWSRKKGKGQFAIYGNPVDLSEVVNQIALTADIKVLRKPKKSVTLGMDCGYPCRGEIFIQGMLREFEIGKWTTIPIPVNCFVAKGLDPSKINSPFMIATEDRFEIELTNIRMELLPEGAPTCAGQ